LTWKPNKWIAVALSLFLSPFGLLYVERPLWAALAFLGTLSAAILGSLHLAGLYSEIIATIVQIAVIIGGAVLSYRIAVRATACETRPWYTRWYGFLGFFVPFCIVIVLTRIFFYEPFRAPSESMAPAVERGSNLIVQKWGYGHYSAYGMKFASRPIQADLKRGDIVVFEYPLDPSTSFLKRIVGLPGDKIAYRNNHLIVNGLDSFVRKSNVYLHSDSMQYSNLFLEQLGDVQYETMIDDTQHYPAPGEFEFRDKCVFDQEGLSCDIPAGRYFVLGDYRSNSADSRQWGFVRSDQIIGKVVKIIR
jgi:signal peptidase I